jgi:hypothetical protein
MEQSIEFVCPKEKYSSKRGITDNANGAKRKNILVVS